jgi:hypothetical protein
VAADLSGYKVSNGETSSSSKFDSLVQTIEDALNALGDTSKTAWGAGQILALSQLSQSGAVSGHIPVWNGSAWAATNPNLSSLAQSGASVGQVPAWSGSAWVASATAGGPTVYVKTTEKDVVNTTVATDLFNNEITVAANKLSTTGAIKIWAGGDYLNSTGTPRNLTLNLNLGGTAIWTATIDSTNTWGAGSRAAWKFEAVVQALSSTSSQRSAGEFRAGPTTFPASVGTGGLDNTGGIWGPFLSIASSVDMTSAQALTLKATHGLANAGISVRCEFVRVEVT